MPTLQEKRDQVNSLIGYHIKTYVLGDLDVLDTIQPNPTTGLNACAIPTAMLVMGTIELMGFLMQNTAKTSESERNIRYALNYKGYFPHEYSGQEMAKMLTVVYRHGMMHFFFPKQYISGTQYSICKSNSSSLFIDIQQEGKIIRSLNANVFSKDFRAFLEKVFDEINTSMDETLLDNIIKSFGNSSSILEEEIQRIQRLTPQTTMPPPNLADKK